MAIGKRSSEATRLHTPELAVQTYLNETLGSRHDSPEESVRAEDISKGLVAALEAPPN